MRLDEKTRGEIRRQLAKRSDSFVIAMAAHDAGLSMAAAGILGKVSAISAEHLRRGGVAPEAPDPQRRAQQRVRLQRLLSSPA